MKRLRRSEHREVETMLRELRPRPPAAFLMASADEVRVQRRRRGARRTALAVAFSAAMLAAFGALGGLGYASSAVKQAVHVTNIAKLVGVSNSSNVTPQSGSQTHNPTFDEYRPGKGCGDKNHIHLRENECKKPPK